MKQRLFILLYFIQCVYANAQQPPAQLPSLLDNIDSKIPVLHKGENAQDIIREKIYVKAETSATSVFAGESFLVTYKQYTALNSQARVSKQPLFSGCSVLELASPDQPDEVMIEGKKWQVFTIRKVQVTPLLDGFLQLNKLYVDNVVQLLNEESLEVENFSLQLSNEPVLVNVKPLPKKGMPGGFSGMVGDYSIRASVDSNKIPAGENATLKITISGNGNIAGIRLPTIAWPELTEHFDGTDTQFVNQQTFPVKGSKIFELPFIGSKESVINIPPINFSFFDPAAKIFKTVHTDSIPVTFTKAVSRQDQIPAIITDDISNKKYLWIVGAIAITVISAGLVMAWLHKRKNIKTIVAATVIAKNKLPEQNLVIKADTTAIFEALNHLSKLETKQEFLSQAKSLLTKTIQQKTLSISISEEILVNELRSHKQLSVCCILCENIYAECNRNLYTPDSGDDIKEKIYFDLTAVLKQFCQEN